MAVKRYDGSAWQTVAGLGAQGAAATSSSIATWVKTASGGETSLSGNDDNSQALSYTVGQELVFINGTLLKRGSDYTATNGTSITGLTALAANDVATVWTVNAFSVTGAIANTIVDAKGDLLVGTAADTPGRLAVGTDGQVLTAASTTGTGLTWATPAGGGGKVLQVVSTTYATQSVNTTIGTFADTGLSLSITPSSATSKVLVIITQAIAADGNPTSEVNASVRLLRGATEIWKAVRTISTVGASANMFHNAHVSITYLDSPNTTSSTTYKTQATPYNGATRTNAQWGNEGTSVITLLEIGAQND